MVALKMQGSPDTVTRTKERDNGLCANKPAKQTVKALIITTGSAP